VPGSILCEKAHARTHERPYTNGLDGDEVILGGPVRNEEAERLVKQIPDLGDIAVFKYNDAGPYSLFIRTAENKTFEIDKYEPHFSGGFPRRDLCIIMAASLRNMPAQRRRVIWYSGFTSYGTSAGAQYFFDDLARMPRRKLRLLVGSQRRFGNWGKLIIEAEFSGPRSPRTSRRGISRMVGSPPTSSQVTAVCVRGSMLVPVRLCLSGQRSRRRRDRRCGGCAGRRGGASCCPARAGSWWSVPFRVNSRSAVKGEAVHPRGVRGRLGDLDVAGRGGRAPRAFGSGWDDGSPAGPFRQRNWVRRFCLIREDTGSGGRCQPAGGI
jgi:hypothetical protein